MKLTIDDGNSAATGMTYHEIIRRPGIYTPAGNHVREDLLVLVAKGELCTLVAYAVWTKQGFGSDNGDVLIEIANNGSFSYFQKELYTKVPGQKVTLEFENENEN